MEAITNSISATTPTTLTAAQIDPAGLKESVATVLSSLTKQKVAGNKIENSKLSEDVLFAALVHLQLRNHRPELAKALISRLKGVRQEVKVGQNQATFRAVDQFLAEQVAKGNVSRLERQELTRFAFGKAQLDDQTWRINRRPVEASATKTSLETQTNSERVFEAVNENTTASKAELSKFRKFAQTHDTLDQVHIKQQQKFWREMTQGSAALNPHQKDENSASAPSETDKPSAKPDPSTAPTEPTDFVYKPRSERDGNALVIVPIDYANDVDAVSVWNLLLDSSLELVHSGQGNDGRSYWRHNRPGDDFTDGSYIKFHFLDGSTLDIAIDSPTQFYKRAMIR